MTPLNDDTAVITAVPAEPDDTAGTRDDGLAAEIAKAAPKRWWNRTTLVLGAIALLLGGFVGGLQAQKQWGTSTTAGARGFGAGAGAGAGRYPGGFPGAGTGQGRQPEAAATAAAATTGTVKLVDGSTIYVQTADGSVVTVKTDGKTTVSTAAKGKVADVKAGQAVTVQGATSADGTVTATSVTAQKR